MTLRLGVLLPESTFIPRLAKGYLYALKAGLARQGVEVLLQIEHCGYNAQASDLARYAAKLLIEHEVHAVIAPLNPCLAGRIKSPFVDEQTPLIVNHLGEDFLPPAEGFEGLFLHGLNESLCHWLGGYRAGQNGGRVATLVSLHESGYRMLPAFVQGLQAAGGQWLGGEVIHHQGAGEDCGPALRQVLAQQPDTLAVLSSGRQGAAFLQQWGAYDGWRPPLLASHPLLTPEVLAQAGDAACGVESVALWDSSDETCGHDDFVQGFRQPLGRDPDPYALLGYESALMLGQALRDLGEENPTPRRLREQLAQVQAAGPRGTVRFDDGAMEPPPVCGLYRVARDEGGILRNVKVQTLEIPPLYGEQMRADRQQASKTGWTNPYLVG